MKIENKRLILFTVSFALFMDVLDSNIINTSIPIMSKSLNVHPIDLKLALISYLLSLAVFIPISGWTADKYGIKRIFIAAFGLFTISSFFCGYAHTLTELVLARSVQGMGGAFMVSLGRLIVARTFKRHQLIAAMNTVIIVVAVAVMSGPFIGGFITEHWSWPWIFWVNLPIGIVAMLLASYSLKAPVLRKVPPFDWVGFILFGTSLALLCLSLSELSESKINLYFILVLLFISIFMMVFYFIHSKSLPNRIIKVELLNIRTFRISVLGNLCTRLSFGGIPFLLPLLLQIGLNYRPQSSGLLLMPMAFGIVFSKLLSLGILRRLGYRLYLICNTILLAIILFMLQIINEHTTIYTIIMLTFISGIVMSSQMTAMNSLAFADINEEELGASTSITSTVQVLSQSLGVAVGAILLRFFSLFTTQSLSLSIFHQAFFAMGLLTLFSCIIFFYLRPDDGEQMLII